MRAWLLSARLRIKRHEIIDLRLADMVEAANRNAETIDERLVARMQAMSEDLAKVASEAEFGLGDARSERRRRDQGEG